MTDFRLSHAERRNAPDLSAPARTRGELTPLLPTSRAAEDAAAAIRAAIIQGAGPNSREIASRRDAIAAAIREAGRDDIVLIAGKGHEQGQIVGAGEATKVLPFDDVTVARECAAAEGV